MYEYATITVFFLVLDFAAVLDPPLLLYKNSYTLCAQFFSENLFEIFGDLKVFFKRIEVDFKISFLKVLKTMTICIKCRQKS